MSGTGTDKGMDPGNKSASEIENEVEQTRARVTETIEALRDRMSPGQMVDQVMEYARGSGGADFMRNFGTSVRDNPLPVALVGLGVGWLLLSGDRKSSPGRAEMLALPAPMGNDSRAARFTSYPGASYAGAADQGTGMRAGARAKVSGVADSAREGMESIGDAASDMADRARGAASRAVDAIAGVASGAADTVSGAASGAAGTASRLADGVSDAASGAAGTADHLLHRARDTAGRAAESGSAGAGALATSARRGWSRMAEEQPLLMGALGLAIGAALGAVLPRTRTEDELMGRTSDELTERAGTMAQDGMERVAEVAGQQIGRVQAVAADTYTMSKDKLNKDGLTADSVGDVIGTAAGRVAEAAKETVRGVTEEARRGLGPEQPAKEAAGEPSGQGPASPGFVSQGGAPATGGMSGSPPAPTAFPSAPPSSGAGSSTRSGPL